MRQFIQSSQRIPGERLLGAFGRRVQRLRVEPVALDHLLAQSDFVALCCPLNETTRGLIDARALDLMQKHAYLINTARGEVVNEARRFARLKNSLG